MLKKNVTLLAVVFLTLGLVAQAPQRMSYQAVIRNSGGELVSNQMVSMRISILQGSATGTTVYVETQTPMTNANGLVSIEIGGGAGFETIDWANGSYFLKIEIDPSGGIDYTISGTTQLLSVPYALHAKTAEMAIRSTTETDPIFRASPAFGIEAMNLTNWSTAYSWGNHASEGYLKSFTETDPIFGRHVSSQLTTALIDNWNSAYSWGNHASEGYLKSYTETDPVFSTSFAKQITDIGSGKIITDEERTKLNGISPEAEVNVQPNWLSANPFADDYILNKPILAPIAISGKYADLVNTPFNIALPSDGQLLKYNSTSGLWENWTPGFLTSFTEVDPFFNTSTARLITNAGSGRVITDDERTGLMTNNTLLSSSPGIVASGKAVIVDNNRDVSSFRNLTANGTINANGITSTGSSIFDNLTINNVLALNPIDAPTTAPEEGQLYIDKNDHKIYCYLNGEWSQLMIANSPVLVTSGITNISFNSATCGGDITSDRGSDVSARGVCWSTTENPTILGNRTTDGAGTGVFQSNIVGLTENTTYYVRAYATNRIGTSYGDQKSFITTPALPIVTTSSIADITQTSATSGGNISYDGGASITARGVCWSTSSNPTIADTKTTDGTGTGVYTSNLTGLTGNTTYYVRSYATNSVGTSYGSEVNFKTSPVLPTVTTSNISVASSTTALTGGNVLNDGGASVVARGVCWSTNENPTIDDDKTTDGTGMGSFISNLTGLVGNTNYYLRAYATNSIGTKYGEEKSFITNVDPEGTFIDIRDNREYKWVRIGTQTWMAENLAYLPAVSPSSENSLTSPVYYVYGYEGTDIIVAKATANYDLYGTLYNWQAAQTACPAGWHLSSDEEWKTMEIFLGMSQSDADATGWRASGNVGNKLKEEGTSHWESNSGATNSSGFTALPGGYRLIDVGFHALGTGALGWSSSEYDASLAWRRALWCNYSSVYRGYDDKRYGFTVRCVKGN